MNPGERATPEWEPGGRVPISKRGGWLCPPFQTTKVEDMPVTCKSQRPCPSGSPRSGEKTSRQSFSGHCWLPRRDRPCPSLLPLVTGSQGVSLSPSKPDTEMSPGRGGVVRCKGWLRPRRAFLPKSNTNVPGESLGPSLPAYPCHMMPHRALSTTEKPWRKPREFQEAATAPRPSAASQSCQGKDAL